MTMMFAKLALERAPAGERNAAEHRSARVARNGADVAPGPTLQETAARLFRFADNDHIGQAVKVVFLHTDPRTADDREDATGFEFAENLAHLGVSRSSLGEP
jgi:hypothetical protein